MDYTRLGRTGLKVSPLCLGTMNFGPRTEEADAFEIMDVALEQRINFFDTANGYGGGETERIIGRWFAQGGGRREKTVVATKLYGSMSDWPNDTFLSARNIRLACDTSLQRLQTDYIDLYQMHHVDRSTPWDEIWEAFEVLRQQGKVVYFGSSNHAGWHITQAQETARRRGGLGLRSGCPDGRGGAPRSQGGCPDEAQDQHARDRHDHEHAAPADHVGHEGARGCAGDQGGQ